MPLEWLNRAAELQEKLFEVAIMLDFGRGMIKGRMLCTEQPITLSYEHPAYLLCKS